MDADNTGADAADHPMEVLRGADMGRSGCEDGTEGNGRQRENGIYKFHEIISFFSLFSVLKCYSIN